MILMKKKMTILKKRKMVILTKRKIGHQSLPIPLAGPVLYLTRSARLSWWMESSKLPWRWRC